MATLKSRERFMPGGFRYYQPETKWKSQPGVSFDTVVRSLISHRQANAFLRQKHNWATDYDSVANEVDQYCTALCLSHGWLDYVLIGSGDGGATRPAAPFLRPPARSFAQSVRSVAVAGPSTIAEMFGVEGPVAPLQAYGRAKVCVACPLNEKGDWTRFFTVPAAAAMKQLMEFFGGTMLRTPQDEQLHVCGACACPTKLKVWTRLSHILNHMPSEDFDALHADCWIRKENHDASATPAPVLPAA